MGINVVKPGEWVESYEDLEPNIKDLIEFNRGTYKHWAMYIDEWNDERDMVVHFNPCDREKVGLGWIDGIVTVDKIEDVADSDKMRINNIIDETPRPWKDIKAIVKKLEDVDGCRYSLVTNNCENFATYLRFPVTSGFRSQLAGGLLSYVWRTWHIGTNDNGKMQTKQWDEYVLAVDEDREPKHVISAFYYM